MRRLLIYLLSLLTASVSAQDFQIRRGDCTPQGADKGTVEARAMASRRLPVVNKNWDPNKTYRQLVILIAFKGDETNFSMENPQVAYNKLFNEAGYNQRKGKGCVADYFRDQSNGMLNLQFDVYGPYQVSLKAQPYENPTSSTHNYGRDAMTEATKMFLKENPSVDFSVYDWNGDGSVNQVIYVTAGYGGNIDSKNGYGYIWPNTSTFTAITTPDGKKISDYTVSAELWPNNVLCGIGTICHEFTHSLGLPDLYPTNNWMFAALDEWDLMDGGNFTNYGWCPPNFTPLEKMLLGWLTPVELTGGTTIKGLKPVENGGKVYQVKHTADEFLLLENRQWSGWDFGAPGKGLVIYHVNYDASKWRANTVNSTKNKLNYCLVNADNMNYAEWDDYVSSQKLSTYRNSARLNNRHLSTSSYPWSTDSTTFVNNALTDTSVPAAQMYNENAEGSTLLGKSITNIVQHEDGTVSFDFMGGDPTGIKIVENEPKNQDYSVYDLQGRRVKTQITPGLYIRNGKKFFIK